jgi:hypothetical protein
MHRSVLARAACLAAAASIAVSGVALAAGSSVKDPKGDVSGDPCGGGAQGCHKSDYDIVKAKARTAAHGKLVHTIKVAGHIGNTGGSGPSGSQPDINIDVPGGRKPPHCDYFVQPVPPGAPGNSSKSTKWFVFKCSNGPNPKITGNAKAKRVNAHTDRIRFSKKAIGSPGKYRWVAYFPGESDTAFDRAPDKGMVKLKLH